MLAAKRNAAQAAIALVPQDCLLGVGTGSTTNEFIALLPEIRDRIIDGGLKLASNHGIAALPGL